MRSLLRICSTVTFALLPSICAHAADLAPSTAKYSQSDEVHARTVADNDEQPIPHQKPHLRRLDELPGETVTFLGVDTVPVSPTLIAQLSLPNHAGLVVMEVVPDSAAAAVLQPHDILLKFDDQILVDHHQLSVLIQSHKPGDEVTLTYLRAGKTATVKVKLGQHEEEKMGDNRKWKMHSMVDPHVEIANDDDDDDGPQDTNRVLALIDSHRRGGAAVEIQPEGKEQGFSAVRIDPDNSNLVFSDEKGSMSLMIKSGKKTLVAKDPSGKQVFSGPVTTPEERKVLPADLRERLEKMESMQNMTFRTGPGFDGGQKIIYRPHGRALHLVSRAKVQACTNSDDCPDCTDSF